VDGPVRQGGGPFGPRVGASTVSAIAGALPEAHTMGMVGYLALAANLTVRAVAAAPSE